jgi:D-glycero-D-manno-heptose 1,7-bisphosphate phosphatase
VAFLDYLIGSLVDVGIRRVLFLVGYKSEVIMDAYGDSVGDGIAVEYSVGKVEDETGRRLLNAYDMLDERFLLLYGDNYWPIEFEGMLDLYERTGAKVTTTVFSNEEGTGEYGHENNVEVGEDGYVRCYDKKRQRAGLNGVDIGYFVVDKGAIDPSMKGNVSFERDVLPGLISRRELAAYVTDGQYYYITSMETLRVFESAVKERGFLPVSMGCCQG